VPDVEIGSSRVKTRLDAQRAATLELRSEVVLTNTIDGALVQKCKLFV